ncbi:MULTISPECIES: hypothetical protein [unclassified Flavobacterium]|jgi:hypothetical protein|uniref:hypothetical protein n=1 Tax=unclassified Flavobacterium TaxID=196869 RepID=UPI0025BADBF2|nr:MULTISPECIES: hypothetical protein [unclassified Flavobacterium]
MILKINITEFRERLNKNTKYGNPKIKGTPFGAFYIFGESNKIFFGTYDKNKFELTKNFITQITPYIISGEIQSKNNIQTEVNYEIKPIGFGYYWMKYLLLIMIPMFNLILYTQSAPFEIFKIANLGLFPMGIFNYFYMRRKKNKLENDFKNFFEIEI